MDFERANIKALFYDYPIEKFVSILENSKKKPKEELEKEYLSILPLLSRWRESEFTQTEAGLTKDMLQTSWHEYDDIVPKCVSDIYRPLLLVKDMAQKMLCNHYQDGRVEPRVQFESLFRWKDATLYVGEDLFTMAYMAQYDLDYEKKPQQLFLWSDTLRHNEQELDDILQKGLTDLHAHYNATTDVFHFNWISLVNAVRHKSGVAKIKHFQELFMQTPEVLYNFSQKSICVGAAYLRVLLYKTFVIEDKNINLSDYQNVCRILSDEPFDMAKQQDLQVQIDALRQDAFRMRNGHALDYAIRVPQEKIDKKVEFNLAYNGERLILYRFFYQYLQGCDRALVFAPYFYLYILLRTRVRREIIQINAIKGFENFEDYQNRKGVFIEEGESLDNMWGTIVLQSTVTSSKDYLEARITPKNMLKETSEFSKSLWGNTPIFTNTEQLIGLVIHFIKKKEEKDSNDDNVLKCRYEDYQHQIHENIEQIVHDAKRSRSNSSMTTPKIRIVGIDAASTEMFCRPEVFGHVYRYAKRKEITGRTYHVGEDFFDLIDGLRAIDEAIHFLELDSNSRIGHGLALAVDVQSYYKRRHNKMIMPIQYVLDCCIWTLRRCEQYNIPVEGNIRDFLMKTARKCYEKIGYKIPFDEWDYWESMQLRGNDPMVMFSKQTTLQSVWRNTALIKGVSFSNNARQLYEDYHYDNNVKKNGKIRYSADWPENIWNVVTKLQKMLIREICQMGIAIECNPTSNLKIGFFERYEQHPILTTFFPIDKLNDPQYPLVECSINTDDRGVFATSIYNEYSLIALALIKEKDEKGNIKHNRQTVWNYIETLRKHSERQKFDMGGKGLTEASSCRSKPLVWKEDEDSTTKKSTDDSTRTVVVKENSVLDLLKKEDIIEIADHLLDKLMPQTEERKEDTEQEWFVYYGPNEYGKWERKWFKRRDEHSTAWVIDGFVMQSWKRHFLIGHTTSLAKSKSWEFGWLPIIGTNGKNILEEHPIEGEVGTLRIYEDSGDDNWYVAFARS